MKFVAVIAGLASLSAAAQEGYQLFEKLRTVPAEWRKVGVPRSDTRMRFRVALKSPGRDVLEQTLIEISTPSHPKYGQHLSRQELKRMTQPEASATSAVLAWLDDAGVRGADIADDGDMIAFSATIAQAEQLLDTSFAIYRSSVRPIERIRTTHYSLPAKLHEYVQLVQPTTRFGQIRPQRAVYLNKEILGQAGSALNVTACNTTITPTCLRDLYNINGFTPSKPEVDGFIGINGFLEQYARFSDLDTFNRIYAPWARGTNFTWTSVNGGILDQKANNDSVEANLDIQYTVSLTAPLRNNFYSTPNRGPLVPDLDQPNPEDNSNEPYLEFFTYLLGLDDKDLPHTLSTSYGEDEQSLPESYTTLVCDQIMKLGARGVSIFFSSGDTGVGSACQTNDGKNTTRFLPIFPASCPYVTAVGGTTGVQPERAVSFSSGGFSDRFPTPKWQADAVKAYLTGLGDRWKGLYNPAGRGFPDISAQGRSFRVVDKGRDISVGGTSASAPTVASIVALLNAARKEKGLPVLGFINPWLYSEGVIKTLTDITAGGSTGCSGIDIYSGLPTPVVPYASWNATKGWDPVTGLGTPDFGKLLALATAPKGYVEQKRDRSVRKPGVRGYGFTA